jgi:pyrimidine-nucleoside phosphorylase
MIPYEIILKKRDGKELSFDEISFMVKGFTSGEIADYQFAAFLMAIYFQGMNFKETAYLTQTMVSSGKVFDLSKIPGPKVDKHSTGGVGDKISLALAPLAASCGLVVPMISGRGLGHTGGTLDKLESIPGFRTSLDEKEAIRILKKIGVVIMGPTANLVPADKKIYALRDVTATVDSIPLISASIMSKKLAEGIGGLVLDIKVGSGAFMKDLHSAKKLAETTCTIGKMSKIQVSALITDMSQPLGYNVGNALEVIEAIELLKNHGPKDVLELTLSLGEEMLKLGRGWTRQKSRAFLLEALNSGKALAKLREMIKEQGGDEKIIDDYSRLPAPQYRISIVADKTGYINEINALKIGLLSIELGCGRWTMSDTIDYTAGFVFKKKVGDRIKKGEELVVICGSNLNKVKSVKEKIMGAYKIAQRGKNPRPLIWGRIS